MQILSLLPPGAGWIPATLLFVVVGIMSGLSAGFVSESMTLVPGNERFQGRVEMMFLAQELLPRLVYLTTIFFFIFNLQITNISAIIESAQTTDATLISIFGKTCGLNVVPDKNNHGGFQCVGHHGAGAHNIDDSPFGDSWVVSLGFILIAVVSIPLGYWNLDDNMIIQIFCTVGLAAYICVVWLVDFGHRGIDFSTVPAVGTDAGAQIGPILFNYAFIVTVPSWVNEKKPGVSVNKSIWWSLVLGVLCFVVLGWVGAAAVPPKGQADLLAMLSVDPTIGAAKVGTFLFPWIALVSGIPIFSIIIRYNILENGLCESTRWANFWAVLFPWICAIVLYAGNLLNEIMNWGSLLTTVPLNIMPVCFLQRTFVD